MKSDLRRPMDGTDSNKGAAPPGDNAFPELWQRSYHDLIMRNEMNKS